MGSGRAKMGSARAVGASTATAELQPVPPTLQGPSEGTAGGCSPPGALGACCTLGKRRRPCSVRPKIRECTHLLLTYVQIESLSLKFHFGHLIPARNDKDKDTHMRGCLAPLSTRPRSPPAARP